MKEVSDGVKGALAWCQQLSRPIEITMRVKEASVGDGTVPRGPCSGKRARPAWCGTLSRWADPDQSCARQDGSAVPRAPNTAGRDAGSAAKVIGPCRGRTAAPKPISEPTGGPVTCRWRRRPRQARRRDSAAGSKHLGSTGRDTGLGHGISFVAWVQGVGFGGSGCQDLASQG